MARKKITGFSLPIGGIQWADVPDYDRAAAKSVLAFLEDRRVLFGERHVEDHMHCLRSVFEIRAFLTGRLTAASDDLGDELVDTLKAMRACCRRFIEAGGHNGQNFWPRHHAWEADPFGIALGDFRTSICFYVAGLARLYKLTVAEELAAVLPVPQPDDDLSEWIPGFEP